MDINIVLLIISFILYVYSKIWDYALNNLHIKKIRYSAEEGNKDSIYLLEILDNFERIDSCIQFLYVASFLSTIFSSINVYSQNIVQLIPSEYTFLGWGCFFLSLIILMYIVGNIVTKRIGVKKGFAIVSSCKKIILFLSAFLMPIVFPCLLIGNFIASLFGGNIIKDENDTGEEIKMLVGTSKENDSLDDSEKEMINNIFEFNSTIVKEIATHRTDLVAVSESANFEEIITVISKEKYSRILVYRENLDNIIGFFKVSDLLMKHIFNKDEEYPLKDILFDAYYVPFSKKSDELFKDMQENKIQIAVVIDEYGGTSGIVTMEDLIEVIVGNIFDEYDVDETEDIQQFSKNEFLISGQTSLKEVQEVIDVEFDKNEDYDTLGGFYIGLLGHIPDENNKPKVIVYKNIILEVYEIIDKRIELIKVTKVEENENAEKQ